MNTRVVNYCMCIVLPVGPNRSRARRLLVYTVSPRVVYVCQVCEFLADGRAFHQQQNAIRL